MFAKARELFLSPTFWMRAHGALTLVWLALIVPSVLWWRESVTWVVFMSLWANIASHLAGWVAGRTEVKQDEMNGENGDHTQP